MPLSGNVCFRNGEQFVWQPLWSDIVTLFQQGVVNAAASAISSFSFFEVVEFQFGKQRQVNTPSFRILFLPWNSLLAKFNLPFPSSLTFPALHIFQFQYCHFGIWRKLRDNGTFDDLMLSTCIFDNLNSIYNSFEQSSGILGRNMKQRSRANTDHHRSQSW